MSKFIEVTAGFRNRPPEDTVLVNVNLIKKIMARSGYTTIIFESGEMHVQQTYDEIKAMIMYDPAVADIYIKGKELS